MLIEQLCNVIFAGEDGHVIFAHKPMIIKGKKTKTTLQQIPHPYGDSPGLRRSAGSYAARPLTDLTTERGQWYVFVDDVKETAMVEKLIINDENYSLYLIKKPGYENWINFRVKSIKRHGSPIKRSRLAYNRVECRLARSTAAKNFQDKSPEGLLRVVEMIEEAIKKGLV